MTVDRKRLRELALAANGSILLSYDEAISIWKEWRKVATDLLVDDPGEVLALLDAAEQPAPPTDDARDAARYRYWRENHVLGARFNGQVANVNLLGGHRDRNRLLISVLLRDDAATVYASPTMGDLDAALDAAIAEQAKGRE